ncbi:MAG TPA: sterol desaturase family protein [Oligoflexus sp.]|uniref:sterol desaturase family protein n=1 Tax=Oligoflexus sp. TaxID=1971216 RepID=UPI002D2D90F2|nr:sterol desaturase family protein [Oligoflexus sp.]HYX37793.1 sterol desaturase family protein [Oligoflexus sp.]
MSYQIEQYRQIYRDKVIPGYYSGVLHLTFTLTTLVVAAALLFSQVRQPTWMELLLIPVMLLLGELVVFVIHKFPLHRPLRGVAPFTFRIHALQHHRFFTDACVTWRDTRDFHIMLFPPLAIIGYIVAGAPLLFGLFWLLFGVNAGWIGAGMGAVYFLLYELVHFCSHLPEDHWVMRLGWMRYQREFHRLHHDPRYMDSHNFGVVYPLWDFVFKTAVKPVRQP